MSGKRTLIGSVLVAAGLVAAPFLAPRAAAATAPTAEVFQITAIQAGGVATVEGIGDVDPSQPDSGSHMQLYVDGAPITSIGGTQPCGGATPNQCNAFFKWDTSALSGSHTVQVQFTTAGGQQVMSPPKTYDVWGATTATLDLNVTGLKGPWAAGSPLAIRGTVSGTSPSMDAAHVPVTVTFTPVVGTPSAISTTTDANGLYSVNYTPKANTTINVITSGTARWGSSSTSTTITVSPALSCSLAHGSVTHGHSDTVTCKLPGLPSGTATTLQYKTGGKWVTYGHGHSTAGKATFAFTLKKKGTCPIEVLIADNHAYALSAGTAKVKVT